MKKKISVVVPMYYEEDMVNICYAELKKIMSKLKKYDYEFIFINDGSKDRTEELLEELAQKNDFVKVISLSRNFGHQAAVSAGLNYVTGDATVIIDADLQDPPKVIPRMLKLWESGYDVVYGKRKHRDGETKFKLATAKLFYRILNHLSDVEIPKDTGDFRVVDRKVVDVINSLPEHNKFLRGLFSYTGFNQTEFLYEREERHAGRTKYTLKKMVKLANDGIFSFSKKPLTFILILSILFNIAAIAALVCIFVFIKHYLVPLIVFLFTFNTSIILLALYIIAIYIGRIYDESKNRPSYIIAKTINIKEKK